MQILDHVFCVSGYHLSFFQDESPSFLIIVIIAAHPYQSRREFLEPNPGIEENLCNRLDCGEVWDWSGDSGTVGISMLRGPFARVVETFELLVEEPVELGVWSTYSPSTYMALLTKVDRR